MDVLPHIGYIAGLILETSCSQIFVCSCQVFHAVYSFHDTEFLLVLIVKGCFPLAEERMKREKFFSHTSGSLGASVCGGSRSHDVL